MNRSQTPHEPIVQAILSVAAIDMLMAYYQSVESSEGASDLLFRSPEATGLQLIREMQSD